MALRLMVIGTDYHIMTRRWSCDDRGDFCVSECHTHPTPLIIIQR